MSTAARRERLAVGPAGLAALLIGAALLAWIVTIDRMAGMDAGPGTDLGGLGWYVGIWVTMMAAMMLPSSAPTMLMFARMTHARAPRRGDAKVATATFVAGYLAVWTLFGLLAYGIFQLVSAIDPAFLAWDAQGPLVAGAAVAAAGLYQLSPLKRACLRHCRSPLHFLMHAWRPGALGAMRLGVVHGAYCVGCCAGLMVILFAVGVMSIFWMATVAAVVFAEKLLPVGPQVRIALATALIGLGVSIVAAPGSVPALHQPGEDAGMPMQMKTAP